MTLIASLLFAIALFASVGVIVMTTTAAMPRITEVIETEFAPTIQTERRIIFGEIKIRKSAPAASQVIRFPRKTRSSEDFRLAA